MRIRKELHPHVDGNVRQRTEHASSHHDPFAADTIGKPAEKHEQRRRDEQRRRNHQVRRYPWNLEHALHERQRIELSRVPDHALARGHAEQRQQYVLHVDGIGETLLERVGRSLSAGLQLGE